MRRCLYIRPGWLWMPFCGWGNRRLISRRGLLEWTSAQVTHRSGPRRQPWFVATLGLASLFSGIVGWVVQRWMPSSLTMASPWLVLWFLSPLLGWLLNLRPQAKQKQLQLPEKDLGFLRMVARTNLALISRTLSAMTRLGFHPTTTRSPLGTTWRCVPVQPTSASGCSAHSRHMISAI